MSYVPSPVFRSQEILSAIGHLNALARNVEYLYASFFRWQAVSTSYLYGQGSGFDPDDPILPREIDGSLHLIYDRAFRHKEERLRFEFNMQKLSKSTPFHFRFFNQNEESLNIIRNLAQGAKSTEFNVQMDLASLEIKRNDFYRVELWMDTSGVPLHSTEIEIIRVYEFLNIGTIGIAAMAPFTSGTRPTAAQWQQLSSNVDKLKRVSVTPNGGFAGNKHARSFQSENSLYRGYFQTGNDYLYYRFDADFSNRTDATFNIYIENNLVKTVVIRNTDPDENKLGILDLKALGLAGDRYEIAVKTKSQGAQIQALVAMPADIPSTSNPNLIKNGGFEEYMGVPNDDSVDNIKDWNMGNFTGGNYLDVRTDSWIYHGQSVKLSRAAGTTQSPFIQQRVTLKPNTAYWISFFCKSDHNLFFRVVKGSDLSGYYQEVVQEPLFIWTPRRILFHNPAGNNEIIIQFAVQKEGEAFVDNVQVWEKAEHNGYERMPEFYHGMKVTGDEDVKIIRDNIQWVADNMTIVGYHNYGSARWYRRYRRDGAEFEYHRGLVLPLRMVRTRRFLYYYFERIPENDPNFVDTKPQIVYSVAGEQKTHGLDIEEEDKSGWFSVDLDAVSGLWIGSHYVVEGVGFAIEDDEL